MGMGMGREWGGCVDAACLLADDELCMSTYEAQWTMDWLFL
jgi:hypothetical protein